MTIPALWYLWNGKHMIPRHSRLAEQTFTSGHTYRLGIVVEKEESLRTLEQNAKMWAMLNDIAQQKKHFDRRLSADEWKVLFLAEAGYEQRLMPSLDGRNCIPYVNSSRKLTVKQMAELLTCITAWADQNGVKFSNERGLYWDQT
jgi:hypothetical protein